MMPIHWKENWNYSAHNHIPNRHESYFSKKSLLAILRNRASYKQTITKHKEVVEAIVNGYDAVQIETGLRNFNFEHIVVNCKGYRYYLDLFPYPDWHIRQITREGELLCVTHQADYHKHELLVLEALSKLHSKLSGHPDILGFGMGYKQVGGEITGCLGIVVHVLKKIESEHLSPKLIIDKEFCFHSHHAGRKVTIPLDIRECIRPKEESCQPSDLQQRIRPIPGGAAIQLNGHSPGTLGGWVKYNTTGNQVLLSCHHVIWNKRTVGDRPVPGWQDVYQIDKRDQNNPPIADKIGKVITHGMHTNDNELPIDAAIADVLDSQVIKDEISCLGHAVYDTASPVVGMEVNKVGQASGLTSGKITCIHYQSNNHQEYGKNLIRVEGQGQDFSSSGDSGALYLDKNNPGTVVGLHALGAGNNGYGFWIDKVFSKLNLSVLDRPLNT